MHIFKNIVIMFVVNLLLSPNNLFIAFLWHFETIRRQCLHLIKYLLPFRQKEMIFQKLLSLYTVNTICTRRTGIINTLSMSSGRSALKFYRDCEWNQSIIDFGISTIHLA